MKKITGCILLFVMLFSLPVYAKERITPRWLQVIDATECYPVNGIVPMSNYHAYVKVDGTRYNSCAVMWSTESSYMISARCSVNNNGESQETTAWHTLYNTSEVRSDYIAASRSKCTYTAYGESKRVQNGNLYTGQVSKSYT